MNKVIFGRKTIRFSVIRSARRKKTIALSIEPDGKVFVRAPVNTSCSRLTHVVKSKAEWIITKLGSLNDVSQQLKKEFVSGESFYYLGCHMRLKILKDRDVKKTVVRMYRGRLEVIMNPVGKNGKVPEEIRDAITEWYKIQAARRIPERVEIHANKMGLKVPGVFIRDQKKIWGSCSTKGVLRFNWRIIMALMSLVDYVVVHELCHLKYRNHSKSFWRYVGMIMPDYERRREILRKKGELYQF
ncbi:MAG: SprT family zinc-dependent metalloprotease [Nitrospirota bacterium]|nr:SprT family zinc-dependent metalloprotease [Nitrospirota bacterium]